MKKLNNFDLGLSVTADEAGFLDFLKNNGLSAGKKQIAELFEGKRDEVKGFVILADDSPMEPEVVEAPAPVVAPKATDADEKNAFSEDAVAAAVEAAKANGVEVQTKKPAGEAAPKKPAGERVKAVIKASTPKGKIKAVRKGTKIANGLELLAGGTTEAALATAGIGDDVVDFVNRRVTKRGYGVQVKDGSLSLVYPEGVTAIAYSGA